MKIKLGASRLKDAKGSDFLYLFSIGFLLVTLPTANGKYIYTQQTGIYEWAPGDGNYLRSNALGEIVSVGFNEEFGESRERRMLLKSIELPSLGEIGNVKDLTLRITVKKVIRPGNVTMCRIQQNWGVGTSLPTDPEKGAAATQNDATWRFPTWNATSSSKYWKNNQFGGYYSPINCVVITVTTNTTYLDFSGPTLLSRYSDWFLSSLGVILIPSAGILVHLNGTSSETPPEVLFTLASSQSEKDLMLMIYIGGSVGAILLFVVVVVFVVLMRRRSDYTPLYDIEDFVQAKNINLTATYMNYAKVIKESGIRAIDPKDLRYTVENKIGHGSASNVYIATWGKVLVAVKALDEDILAANPKALTHLLRELTILATLKHENILPVLGISLGDGTSASISMVMPLMQEGALSQHLHDEGVSKIDEFGKIKILYEVCEGMNYIHGMTVPVLHRDLKSDNVLLDRDKNGLLMAKIADFGIARMVTGHEMTVSGTAPYMAPETVLGEFSTKSDVYSYAKLFTETINEQRPSTDTFNSFLTSSEDGAFDYDDSIDELVTSPNVLKFFQEIIESALDTNPNNRPSFLEIEQVFLEYFEALNIFDEDL